MALTISNWYTQFFPPKPTFTEADVPSQKGRVFIVTGASAGIGLALCRILYNTGATVYMACRSKVWKPVFFNQLPRHLTHGAGQGRKGHIGHHLILTLPNNPRNAQIPPLGHPRSTHRQKGSRNLRCPGILPGCDLEPSRRRPRHSRTSDQNRPRP